MVAPHQIKPAEMDLASPKAWRRFVPAWLRSLIWADSAAQYDAFLSYSWTSDRLIAPVIQSVIHRFLRPWYKVRAKTVFRDLSCLPAGSSLNNEIFSRLDRSLHLVVLACPEASKSRGMQVEAHYWFSRPERKGEVLIIVTDGLQQQLRPDNRGEDSWAIIRDHLLPEALRLRFAANEPLWVSIEARRNSLLAKPKNEAARGLLIEELKQIFLRLYPGTTWEELHGEERAQRRRAMRLVGAISSVFLVASLLILWLGLAAKRNGEAASANAAIAEYNYQRTVDAAAETTKLVGQQLLPDSGGQSRTAAAQHALQVLKNTFETFDTLPTNRENAAAGFSRVKLLEALWNGCFVLGDYSSASQVANAEYAIAEKHAALARSSVGDPSHADWLRYMCRAKENMGDDARVTKHPLVAESQFREALRFADQLSREPGGEAWPNELAHAHQRLGDALRDQGKFTEAITEFKLGLKLSTKPSDAPSMRDLAVAHGKMGDMLIGQADFGGALEEFESNLQISEKLARLDPKNLDAQRGLAVAHERLGFLLRETRHYLQATAEYKQELEIARHLAQEDASDVQWLRDEALANEGLGDVLRDQDQTLAAYPCYEEYRRAIQQSFDKAKANARIQREVAVAYQRLGDTSLRLGHKKRATQEFQECVNFAERATTAFEPRNPEPRDVLGYCRAKIASGR